MTAEERKHQSFAAREESAKRQKRVSLKEEDEVDAEAENGDSNSIDQGAKLCKDCEEELGDRDSNGQGFTCNCCFGGCCDLKQICNDCLSDGFVCSTCEKCYSHDCSDETEYAQFICDECHNIYCKECSDPKPGKNGTKRCYNCQPWHQRGKPADAFCKNCGSQRSDAEICTQCDERVCKLCPYFTCDVCADTEYFRCEDCGPDSEVIFCEKCCISTCLDCRCDCAEEEDDDDDDEEEEDDDD